MNFNSFVQNHLVDQLRARVRATSAVDAYMTRRETSLVRAHSAQVKRLEREHRVAVDRCEFTFSHELGRIDRALDGVMGEIRAIEPVSIKAFPVDASSPPGAGSPFGRSPEFSLSFTGSSYLSAGVGRRSSN